MLTLFYLRRREMATSPLQAAINAIADEALPVERFASVNDLVQYVKNTHGVKCPLCSSENVYEYSVQTRSIDEAETMFYICLNCNARWRR